MKRICIVLFIMTLVSAGCQTTVIEFTDKTPDVSTGEASDIGTTSVVLSGSFIPRSSIDIYEAVYCFCVSDNMNYQEFYYFDSYEYADVVTKTIEINDLLPNTTYYYKFGAVHGRLNDNGFIDRFSPSEVWGEEKSFATGKVLPKIKNIVYNDYSYEYINGSQSNVRYYLTVELDSPITGYVDSECEEYGFYIIADDKSFEKYVTPVSVKDSGKSLHVYINFNKEDYTISRSPEYFHAITSACKVGLYMKNNGIEKFSEMPYSGFEYTLQPNITITDLKQKSIESGKFGENDRWDRSCDYEYSLEIAGALFFDSICPYYYGNWVTTGKRDQFVSFKDGKSSRTGGVWYSSESSLSTDYVFFVAEVADFDIVSSNSISLYYDGAGNVKIRTSSYVPSISYASTKSGTEENFQNFPSCMIDSSIPVSIYSQTSKKE